MKENIEFVADMVLCILICYCSQERYLLFRCCKDYTYLNAIYIQCCICSKFRENSCAGKFYRCIFGRGVYMALSCNLLVVNSVSERVIFQHFILFHCEFLRCLIGKVICKFILCSILEHLTTFWYEVKCVRLSGLLYFERRENLLIQHYLVRCNDWMVAMLAGVLAVRNASLKL